MRSSEQKKKLVEYFKKNFKKGYTTDSLKWALVSQGYSRVVVEESLAQANKELSEEAPILKDKPVIKYEVVDGENKSLEVKKSWWRRLFGMD
ncbi:MAG: hypothetical protein AABW50_00105 [Nanoarchaeota archaeon]